MNTVNSNQTVETDRLTNLLLSIQEEVKQTNNKLDNMDQTIQEIKRDNTTLKTDLKILKRKYDTLAEENKELTEKVNLNERRINYILNKERSKNVVLYKVPDTIKENKNLLATVLDIVRKVNTEIPPDSITDVRRLGKQEGSRPILLSFTNTSWKSLFLQGRKILWDLNYSMANDISKEERERRRKNYEILTKYKDFLAMNGKEATIKGMNITVDSRTLNIEEVKKLLETIEISKENETTYTSDSDESTSSATSTASGSKRGRKPGSKNKSKTVKKQKTAKLLTIDKAFKTPLTPSSTKTATRQQLKSQNGIET